MTFSLPAVTIAIPGDLDTPTGGYAYDKRLIAELRDLGHEIEILTLPASFPFPDAADIATSLDALRALTADKVLIADGLAWSALPADDLDALAAPAIALVHHPLGHETGLDAETAARLIETERRALAKARHVIVTSATTGRALAGTFDIAADRITVAPPGTDPAPPAMIRDRVPYITALGAVIPRKGYDVFVNALAALADLDWQAAIVGPTDRDPAEAGRIAALIEARGLSGRVAMTGAIAPAERDALLADTDLFVLSSFYEGYGMAVAEAIACGLPLVATDAGAVREVMGPDLAVVPTGDPILLADALAPLIRSPDARRALSRRVVRRAADLPRWTDTARVVSATITDTFAMPAVAG